MASFSQLKQSVTSSSVSSSLASLWRGALTERELSEIMRIHSSADIECGTRADKNSGHAYVDKARLITSECKIIPGEFLNWTEKIAQREKSRAQFLRHRRGVGGKQKSAREREMRHILRRTTRINLRIRSPPSTREQFVESLMNITSLKHQQNQQRSSFLFLRTTLCRCKATESAANYLLPASDSWSRRYACEIRNPPGERACASET